MHTIQFETRHHDEFVNLTRPIQEFLDRQSFREGAVLVYCPHTTAGITINESADPDVRRDILTALSRLVPHYGDYRHSEGNSDAHIKAAFTGSSAMIPVVDGKLQLGTWQAIYFCEFDGPRSRKITLSLLNGSAMD